MKQSEEIGLDFEIDKLTNSIENIISGDSFATDITLISRNELKAITKKNGWLFNWNQEFKYPEPHGTKFEPFNSRIKAFE